MTIKDYKKLKALLETVYREVENEAIASGVNLLSPEYDALLEKAKLVVIEKSGFTLEDYEKVEAKFDSISNDTVASLMESTKNRLDEIEKKHFFTKDQIKELAEEISQKNIKKNLKAPEIINKIVKETIIEKPTIVKETKIEQIVNNVEFDDKPIKTELARALQQLDEIKIPEQIDLDKLKEDMRAEFGKTLENNINILDMPNWRKLAMGIQGQIDALNTATATTASNGLTLVGADVRLGGTLIQNTTVDGGSLYSLTFGRTFVNTDQKANILFGGTVTNTQNNASREAIIGGYSLVNISDNFNHTNTFYTNPNTDGGIFAISGIAKTSGTGTTTYLAGIAGAIFAGSTATITHAAGVVSEIFTANSTNATLQNAYGFLAVIGDATNPTNITNAYGFKVERMTGGSGTKWGFYCDVVGSLNLFHTVQIQDGAAVQFHDADGSNYVGLKAPAVVASDHSYTLPSAFPSVSGYVLSSTTAGVMSWIAGGGISSITTIGSAPNLNGMTLTGTVLNLEPASTGFGGVVTASSSTTAQSFLGKKNWTFTDVSNASFNGQADTITVTNTAGTTGLVVNGRYTALTITDNFNHADVISGHEIATTQSGTGTITTLVGSKPSASLGSSAIATSVIGNSGGAYTAGTSSTTNAVGTYNEVSAFNTSTITNAIGSNVNMTKAAGATITTGYGYQVSSLIGTTQYAFHGDIAGALNFFRETHIRAGTAIKFYDTDNSNYAGFSANGTTTANVNYTWPAAGPAANGYILSSTTAGVMSWAAAGSGVVLGGSQTGFTAGMVQYIKADGTQFGDTLFIRSSATNYTDILKDFSASEQSGFRILADLAGGILTPQTVPGSFIINTNSVTNLKAFTGTGDPSAFLGNPTGTIPTAQMSGVINTVNQNNAISEHYYYNGLLGGTAGFVYECNVTNAGVSSTAGGLAINPTAFSGYFDNVTSNYSSGVSLQSASAGFSWQNNTTGQFSGVFGSLTQGVYFRMVPRFTGTKVWNLFLQDDSGATDLASLTFQNSTDAKIFLVVSPLTNTYQIGDISSYLNSNRLEILDNTQITTLTTGQFNIAQRARTGAMAYGLKFTGGAHTTLTLSTEAPDLDIAMNRTVQFATGALATQRAVIFREPTYGFVLASTLTDAATVAIVAAPVAGTNATITRSHALWVQGGVSRFDGGIQFSAGGTTYNNTNLVSGTYTPTDSAHVNFTLATDVTMTEAQYSRIGNTVTVSGRFTADPILTATATSFEINLPIASNIGAEEDAAGVAFCGTISGMGAEVIGVVVNDTAKIQWVASDITSKVWSYTFTYQVI